MFQTTKFNLKVEKYMVFGGLGAGRQLWDESVVGLLTILLDNDHLEIIDHSIPAEREQRRPTPTFKMTMQTETLNLMQD